MARRGKFEPQLAAFQSWRNSHTNLGMKLEILNLRTNHIFGLSQPGKPEPTNPFLDPFEPIGAAEAWIGCDIVDRFAR